MTSAEKKKERNRRDYERRKERKAAEKLKDPPGADERHLSIVPPQAEKVENSAPEAPEKAPDLPVHDEKSGRQDSPIQTEGKSRLHLPMLLLGMVMRTLLVIAITAIMAYRQVEFYGQYDLDPMLAWPLAVISELIFLSLLSMKLRKSDWIRWPVCALFYAYICATLSFSIIDRARSNIRSENSVERAQLEEQLVRAQTSLDVATKGRSWENMELFGKEVSRLQGQITSTPKTTALGITSAQRHWAEAVLLITVMMLFMAGSALNVIKIREDLGVLGGSPREQDTRRSI